GDERGSLGDHLLNLLAARSGMKNNFTPALGKGAASAFLNGGNLAGCGKPFQHPTRAARIIN
ncbi:MAG: hypothetical protein ABR568_21555, partial [Pyrinomonadaceae bacterium]